MPRPDYTNARASVSRIQRSLDATIADIRANRSLTDAGRRREMAIAALKARAASAQEREGFTAERQQQLDAARKVAFGSFSDAAADHVAMRDARDRAAKVDKDADAQALLARAIRDNDASLARAVAERAYDRGWGDVVRRYATTYGVNTAIEDLDSTPDGPRTALAEQVVFRIRGPRELAAYSSDSDLERLAAAEVAG